MVSSIHKRACASAANVALALFGGAEAARGQRTQDNAVTSAEDAFGTNVGDYGVGLYDPYNVRGFSAVDAGNVRINGLYFDKQGDFTSHLIEGSTIRVGPSAQGYLFPAPTGIADFKIRDPGGERIISPSIAAQTFGNLTAEVDGKVPLAGHLSLGFGGGIYRLGYETDAKGESISGALIAHWQPARRFSLTAFTGHINFNADASPFLFTAGDFLPPRTKRGLFYGQRWADQHYKSGNSGVIAAAALGLSTEVRAGIFRSVLEAPSSFADIFFDVTPDRSSHHLVVANPPQKFASTSGELRMSHTISDGPRQHVLRLVGRGRGQDRRYGGADLIDYSAATIGIDDPRPKPQFHFEAQSRDTLRQTMLGIAYAMSWGSLGQVSAGVQRTRFSKEIFNPGADLLSKRSSAMLYNIGGSVRVTKAVSAYAGFTRGLEEGGVAPNVATNRNEAFAPIVTRQADAGLRVDLTSRMKLVGGVFRISKPYFGLDLDNHYGELGTIANKGIELSLAGDLATGLSLVAGGVFTRPRLSGQAVRNGLIGAEPLGSRRREMIASLDYAIPSIKSVSVDASFRSVGRQVASINGQVRIPSYSTLGLGMRYRWSIGRNPLVARLAIDNALNKWSWVTDSSGIFYPLPQRAASLTLTADLK